MPRKPNLDRPTRLELKLPETLRARLDLYLFSELEGRVPKGKYLEFFAERVRVFFGNAKLDLSPFGFPQGYYVEGPKDMIRALQERLVAYEHEKAAKKIPSSEDPPSLR